MTTMPITNGSVPKEAFKLVWRHRGALTRFAILPILILWLFWFFVIGGVWFPEIEPYGKKLVDSKAVFPPLFLANMLFTMAWLKHILHPEQHIGFKSYFTFDTYLLLYVGHFLCLLFLVYAFIPSILAIFPLMLVLPALAYGKPFKVWNLMRQPIIFYGKLFASSCIGIAISIMLLVLFWFLGSIILAFIEGSGPLPLDRPPSDEFFIWTLFIISPLVMMLLQAIPLAIITLYYKKGVLGQH